VLESSRMAMRLRPDQLEDLQMRIRGLVADYALTDEPDGDPFAVLLVLHHRPASGPPPSRAEGADAGHDDANVAVTSPKPS
jgi:hypothetical protein